MSVLLLILKIIGIVLLVVLALLVLIIIALLFVPFAYRVKGSYPGSYSKYLWTMLSGWRRNHGFRFRKEDLSSYFWNP